MDASTKKMLYYGGGALLVGAVGFFVYSFFKKDEITVGNTSISLTDEKEPTASTGGFKAPKFDFADSISYEPSPLSDLWAKIK